MKTFCLNTKFTPDGHVHLHIPCDLPPGDAEVVVVIQPKAAVREGPPYPSDEGVWAGKMPDIDISELNEMNQ
jgi:hypothetical protein